LNCLNVSYNKKSIKRLAPTIPPRMDSSVPDNYVQVVNGTAYVTAWKENPLQPLEHPIREILNGIPNGSCFPVMEIVPGVYGFLLPLPSGMNYTIILPPPLEAETEQDETRKIKEEIATLKAELALFQRMFANPTARLPMFAQISYASTQTPPSYVAIAAVTEAEAVQVTRDKAEVAAVQLALDKAETAAAAEAAAAAAVQLALDKAKAAAAAETSVEAPKEPSTAPPLSSVEVSPTLKTIKAAGGGGAKAPSIKVSSIKVPHANLPKNPEYLKLKAFQTLLKKLEEGALTWEDFMVTLTKTPVFLKNEDMSALREIYTTFQSLSIFYSVSLNGMCTAPASKEAMMFVVKKGTGFCTTAVIQIEEPEGVTYVDAKSQTPPPHMDGPTCPGLVSNLNGKQCDCSRLHSSEDTITLLEKYSANLHGQKICTADHAHKLHGKEPCPRGKKCTYAHMVK